MGPCKDHALDVGRDPHGNGQFKVLSAHWLPLRQRVDYKLALITFEARRTGCPVYHCLMSSSTNPQELCARVMDFCCIPFADCH